MSCKSNTTEGHPDEARGFDQHRGYGDFYGQVVVDLIFAIVGGLLAWRRPEDKAIRVLAIAMICWSSCIPTSTAHPVYDILFFIKKITDVNQSILYCAPLAALTEGIFSAQGETRTRIRWGLFTFGFYFFLFPYRIYVEPLMDPYWPDQLPQLLIDNCLQLVLPLGLLYATLRHRLLDLSFALSRSLVFGALSAFVLLTFFGLEKLSEGVLRPEGQEQNALVAGCVALHASTKCGHACPG